MSFATRRLTPEIMHNNGFDLGHWRSNKCHPNISHRTWRGTDITSNPSKKTFNATNLNNSTSDGPTAGGRQNSGAAPIIP
jgi:hypothetical protein